MISIAKFIFIIKKVALSACEVYRKVWLNISRPSILLFVLIKVKTICKTKMKRYAEIRSPCRVPLSSLKQLLVFRPFKIHDFWFLSNFITHFIKSSPKPYRFRTDIKKKWLTELNAFLCQLWLKVRLFEVNL